MTLDLQFKIKNDQYLKRYLRENSHWYKLLNRNPYLFDEFVKEMKTNYKLTISDKITNFTDKLDLVRTVLSVLNTR